MKRKPEVVLLLNGKVFSLEKKISEKYSKLTKFLDSKPNEVFTNAELRPTFGRRLLEDIIRVYQLQSYTYTDGHSRFFGTPSALVLLKKKLKEFKNANS